jgi:hypothetical protein
MSESLFQSLGLSIDADSAVNISSVWYHILNQGTPPLTKTQDFVTFAKGFEYLRSIDSFNGFLGNLCRPGYTYDKIVWMKWLPEVWALFKVRKANEADAKAPALDICTLYQNSTLVLDTMFEIEMVGLAILLLEHKSSPPKQGGRSGSSNTGTTTVRRTPNTMCDACRMWKSRCFIHTGQKACVLCQFRSRLCSFVHNPEPKESLATVNSNGNDDVMRDALYYLSKSLESFLNTAFSKSCCRRKCLSPKDWFQMFAGLCSCSILKSLLIDAQVGIGLSDNGTQANIAARIDSAYKALVSIFAWAAKFDLLVEWYRTTGAEDPLRNSTESEKESFETLCRLVQRDEWENRGIKSSKDFLMGLGSGFYNDGTYNGFYIQRYGLKQPRKSKDESPSRGNEDGAQYSGNSLHQSAPRPPHLRETGHLDERIEAISEQPNDNTAQDSSETHQQLIAEDSTLPNVVPMVDPIQRHRSHNDVNHTWYEPLLY